MEQSLPPDRPISPMPQTSSDKKPLTILAIVLILLVGGYFTFAKTQNAWPFSSQIAEPNQSTTPFQSKFYIQTWSDTPQGNPNLEIYEINNETSSKIFTGSSQTGTILGVIPEELLVVESVSGLPNKLSLYNTTTQKSETLVALMAGHTFVGSLNPNGNQVVFADHCGIGCNTKQGEATSLIKSISLSNKVINTIYTDFAADFNFFYIPSDWASNDTVILTPGIEVGEGPQFYRKVLVLNVQSKQVKELVLDQNARSVSVNPNGVGIIFTTFTYDSIKKTHSSTVAFKSLDGTAKILQNSSQLKYESAIWLDDESIAVLVTTIQSVDEDCAYDVCIEGKRTIQIINTKASNIKNLALPVEPSSIIFGNEQSLYYLSSIETPSTYLKSTVLLHSYNLATGEDKVIFQSPRFINLISQ